MLYNESNLPASPKTAEKLGEEYAHWLKAGKPIHTTPILKFLSTLDLDALRASACQVMKRECSSMYHIATGKLPIFFYTVNFLSDRFKSGGFNLVRVFTIDVRLNPVAESRTMTDFSGDFPRRPRSHCPSKYGRTDPQSDAPA